MMNFTQASLFFDIQLGVMNEMMEEIIGEVEVELDGRFSSIRNKETNLGKRTFSFLITVVYP